MSEKSKKPNYEELLKALEAIDQMPRCEGTLVGDWVSSLLARYHKALDLAKDALSSGGTGSPDPAQAFSDWLAAGPKLAKAAGLYVGIKVRAQSGETP